MTGRELIIYILVNNLEDKEIFKDGQIPGFLTIEEVAMFFNVGIITVMTWISLDALNTITFGGKVYISEKDTLILIKNRKEHLK